MTVDDPYEVLGVTPDADDAVIHAAYKSLIKKHHPDQGGTQKRFREIKTAHDMIKNGEVESKYKNNDTPGVNSLFGLITQVKTESITGSLSDGLVLRGDQLKIALTNIRRVDITDHVYLPDETVTENRLILTTNVQNKSDHVQPFDPKKGRIITEDGRRYDAQSVGLKEADKANISGIEPLPSQTYGSKRKMEPHTKGNFITVIQKIPESVTIHRVIYPFNLFAGDQHDGIVKEKTRYVFDIQPHHWQEFNSIIEGELTSSAEENPNELEGKEGSTESKLETESDRNRNSASRSQTTKETNNSLTEQDAERIADIIKFQPTSNSQLQRAWGMDSGSEVYQYLNSRVSDMYERNEDNKIVATQSAETFIDLLD